MASTDQGDPALADPLVGPVRRRHPEVTVVLLPPVQVPLPPVRPVTLVEARQAPVTVRAEAHATAIEVEATSDRVEGDDRTATVLGRPEDWS